MFVGQPPGNYDRMLDFSRAVTGTLFFVPSASFLDAVTRRPAARAADLPPRAAEIAIVAGDGSLGIGSLKEKQEMNNLHRELAPVSTRVGTDRGGSLPHPQAPSGARRVVMWSAQGLNSRPLAPAIQPVAASGDGIRADNARSRRWSSCGCRSNSRARRWTRWRAAPTTRNCSPSRRRRAGWPSPRIAPSSKATRLRDRGHPPGQKQCGGRAAGESRATPTQWPRQ